MTQSRRRFEGSLMTAIWPLRGPIAGWLAMVPAHAPQQLTKCPAEYVAFGVTASTPVEVVWTTVTGEFSWIWTPAAFAAFGRAAQRSRGSRLCSSSQITAAQQNA